MAGVCLTGSECSARAGTVAGNCASGFGSCCLLASTACGGVLQYNNTYLTLVGTVQQRTVGAVQEPRLPRHLQRGPGLRVDGQQDQLRHLLHQVNRYFDILFLLMNQVRLRGAEHRCAGHGDQYRALFHRLLPGHKRQDWDEPGGGADHAPRVRGEHRQPHVRRGGPGPGGPAQTGRGAHWGLGQTLEGLYLKRLLCTVFSCCLVLKLPGRHTISATC